MAILFKKNKISSLKALINWKKKLNHTRSFKDKIFSKIIMYKCIKPILKDISIAFSNTTE